MKRKEILTVMAVFFSGALFAQHTVKGTVTCADAPVKGLTIAVPGGESTLSDKDGNYSIDLGPKDKTLVFSGDGIISQYVTVKEKQTELNVQVVVTDMDRAVAKGLLDKKYISAAISKSTPNGESNTYLSMKNVIESKVPNVTYSNGYVYIRGAKCLMYLVDGAKVPSLDMVDPGLVEKVEVIRDGTGNIYGADAANGVVMITTKASGK